MFKPTQILQRRIRQFQLTTKQGPKDYYKGTRSGRMGDHTKHGGYVVNYDRVRTYVVPQGLKDFKLTPFVTNKVQPMRGSYGSRKMQPISGHNYLVKWKKENGED